MEGGGVLGLDEEVCGGCGVCRLVVSSEGWAWEGEGMEGG